MKKKKKNTSRFLTACKKLWSLYIVAEMSDSKKPKLLVSTGAVAANAWHLLPSPVQNLYARALNFSRPEIQIANRYTTKMDAVSWPTPASPRPANRKTANNAGVPWSVLYLLQITIASLWQMVAARQAWNARLTTEPGALFNYVNPCLGLFIVALHLGGL